jgi:hypothetical protein
MRKIFWMSVSVLLLPLTPPLGTRRRRVTDSPADLITIDDEIIIDDVSQLSPPPLSLPTRRLARANDPYRNSTTYS